MVSNEVLTKLANAFDVTLWDQENGYQPPRVPIES
jgi:hypothetical protein